MNNGERTLLIATPCYNKLDFIKQTVDSILENTDVDFELCLIYNHPPEEGVWEYLNDVAVGNPITVLDLGENIGCHAAVNLAWQSRPGAYLAKVDDDVVVPASWASKMIEALDTDQKNAFLATDCTAKHGWELEERTYPNGVTLSFGGRIVNFTAMAMKRSMYDVLGPIKSMRELYGFEEHYYCDRAKDMGYDFALVPSVTVFHQGTKGRELYTLWKFWSGYAGHEEYEYPEFCDHPLVIQEARAMRNEVLGVDE